MDIYIKIVNHLLLRSADCKDISLYHGKMGIVLTLYLYAREQGRTDWEELAWDLLQSVYAQLEENLPYNIENGLAGIGYAVTLLKRNRIFDADLNNILWNIDQKIMSYDPRRFKDFSFRKGALGICSYLQLRQKVETRLNSFSQSYFHELHETLVKNGINLEKSIQYSLKDDLTMPSWNIQEYLDHELGIDSGISYYLLGHCHKALL